MTVKELTWREEERAKFIETMSPADQGTEGARQEVREVRDAEKRARDAIQVWGTDTIIDAIGCTKRETWLGRVMRNELAARGVDHKGQWCGFGQSRKIWPEYFDRQGA